MAISIPIWSDDFLESDIREQDEYKYLLDDPSDFDNFLATARNALSGMQGIREPDEAITIERVIAPILDALGWTARLPNRSLTSRDEVDLTLFTDPDVMEQLLGASERQQVLGATGIVECKRWQRDFDAAGTGGNRPSETAAQQIQRYLLVGGTDSDESLRWGILTNGARWRLYSYRTRPRERTWQIDLASLLVSTDLFSQVLEEDDTHRLRTAYLLLRKASWVPAEGERDSLLDRLLDAGRHRDAELADDLSEVVFRNVYPEIVRLFWTKRPGDSSDQIARAALYFLYRLLFIYYAEDRNILDTNDDRYRPYSLRYGVREQVADERSADAYSTRSTRFWRHLKDLVQTIDQGEPAIGVPPYNGGLFRGDHAILDEIELSDAELAPIIYDLSHTSGGTYVSYRNLEVQQLGSIYERLLERVPTRDDDGHVNVTISPYARKDSGSYYTPQELVDLIVEQTLRPLIEERVQAFRDDPIEENDPAAAILGLRVLDPSMGSGHFLITAIDWLTRELASLVDREWVESSGHVSPIRAQLWDMQERFPTLSDDTLLQRMVLKRCIYGVDKNPMAVELARVALWLHTFTGELPLPYLEHRIVNGDSLLGIRGEDARRYISEWGPYPLNESFEHYIEEAAQRAAAHDQLLDLTLDEINDSRFEHTSAERRGAPLKPPLDLAVGLRWLSAGMKKREQEAFHTPLKEVLQGDPGRAVSILITGENRADRTPATPAYREIRDAANAITEREHVLHWELAFPEVMAAGGFDAVIGNPPWDRIKLQEVEWWATRDPDVARARTAAERRRIIGERRAQGDPVVSDFDAASAQAMQLSALVRIGGDYPLLGKGDINLYSLFVERSLSLLNPDGICGLLTPSGIYADKTAADFFRSISTTGRLGGIYDFENRRTSNPDAKTTKWFPDVHPQFKFCATISGGSERRFDEANCGFLLNELADLLGEDRVFPLSPEDFMRINPNTGTAPILPRRRDAEIVSRIYREHPVLVNRSGNDEQRLYSIRYHRMFDMTNDSKLFGTSEMLEKGGAYRVSGNKYKRGDDEWLPLLLGRMIEHFDHRAQGVTVNPANINRPFTSMRSTDEERANPEFFPVVQHWVLASHTIEASGSPWNWAIGFRDITSSTNARTVVPSIVPFAAYSNTVPLLLSGKDLTEVRASLLTANLASLPLDYFAKKKAQSTHMNLFILEQLPMIRPDDFDKQFGDLTARELVRDHVLRLTYTAYDLTPFARDLGYDGDPFIWNAAERRQLRARLDALFFHLYGLSEDDASYILDQFPVLAKNERKEFGHYLTKQLVLGHYRALHEGDTSAVIAEAAS